MVGYLAPGTKENEAMVISLVRQVVTISIFLSALHAEANAETIHLQCSGTFYTSHTKPPTTADVKDDTFTVDLDNNEVSGFYPGDYPITSVDDEKIVFNERFGSWDASGTINRMTGKTTIFAVEPNDPGQLAFMYDLMCSLARRLF